MVLQVRMLCEIQRGIALRAADGTDFSEDRILEPAL